MNGPDSVVDLLQADALLLRCIGNEEQLVLQPERAGVGDALHDETAGILHRRQPVGIGRLEAA